MVGDGAELPLRRSRIHNEDCAADRKAMQKENKQRKQRWSNESGTAISDREAKLNFFQKGEIGRAAERVLCVHRFSFGGRARLAKVLGLTHAQLRVNKMNPDNLSRAALDALGDYFGFNPDCQEWIKGTAREFAEHYNKNNTFKASRPSSSDSERRTDIPLVPHYSPQETGTHRLASMRMEVVLSNDSERWPIKLHLYCRAPNGYGIGKGFVDLYTGDAIAPDDEQNFREAFKLPGQDVTIRRDTTTETRASWAVVANTGIIDDVLPDEPYCAVRKLAPGDKLTVTFSIANKHNIGADGQIRFGDGRPLGRKKNAILDRIASLAVLGDEKGYTVLCRHVVTFENACAELRPELSSELPVSD